MSDLISKQALCKYALNQKDKSVTPNDIMRFSSAQPEQQNCPYCHCYAFVRFGMDAFVLSLRAKRWHGEAKINYCPVCGRGLR